MSRISTAFGVAEVSLIHSHLMAVEIHESGLVRVSFHQASRDKVTDRLAQGYATAAELRAMANMFNSAASFAEAGEPSH